jgi:HD superfamily phosphohydrolase
MIPLTRDEIYLYIEENILPILLPDFAHTSNKKHNKVIHDHLWGSSSFYPWEIALLDTPLLQRLRQIHQLGTACFTYPSAVHNRFSHTLGVTVLAGQLITNLRDKVADGTINCPEAFVKNDIITQRDVFTVRLSALLHDIGHCFFSHCSEYLSANMLINLEESISDQFNGQYSSGEPPKPHEMIAYAIISTNYFKQYWDKFIKILSDSYEYFPDPSDVAQPIIGVYSNNHSKHYLTEIINGPYDVDKLEYLHRDAKSAGLAITYDRDRFFQKITLHYDEYLKSWNLVMGVQGIQSVEQMMLNKMMLAPYVYHHQKVLAADALVHEIGHLLLTQDVGHYTIDVKNYFDFLLYTDADLLIFLPRSPTSILDTLLKYLKNRIFPKRCFVIHKDYIYESSEETGSQKLIKVRKTIFSNIEQCRKDIVEIMRREFYSDEDEPYPYHYFYITSTSIKAKYKNIAKSAMVLTQDNQLAPLSDHWVMGNWDETYAAKKEYIFFHIAENRVKEGYNAVLTYLKKEFKLIFDEDRIKRHIKFDSY